MKTGDGEQVWQQRVKGEFSASPVLADGKLYVVNEAGATSVLDVTGEKPKIVASNELDDTILATPAVILATRNELQKRHKLEQQQPDAHLPPTD